MVASQILGVSDEQYLGLFMGGLREEIRMELQVLEPTTQYKAISMARNVERKLVRAGILKAPAISKRFHKFQGSYLRDNLHYNNARGVDNTTPKFSPNSNLGGSTEKLGEVKKG